jgi:DNA-binding transcriptional LysR family regulator
VARAKGFREGARQWWQQRARAQRSVNRLEAQLGVRLLNRTTRRPTEAVERLLERLGPVLTEVEAALDAVNGFRDDLSRPPHPPGAPARPTRSCVPVQPFPERRHAPLGVRARR